jgi:hypothetical protein
VNARRLLLVPAAAMLLAGCAESVSFASDELACRTGKEAGPANGVLLMAQAVGTASRVPCLNTVPLGWHLSDVQIRDGSGTFWLDSDRDGVRAIEVALTATCSTVDATEVPSDREDVRRLERVSEVSPGYRGTRFYLFDGGCLAVRFRITGEDRAEPLAVATEGIDLLPRTDVQAQVREESGGRLELDPAEGG